MRTRIFILLVSAIFAGTLLSATNSRGNKASVSAKTDLKIIKNSKPLLKVVIPKNPPEIIKFAAEELCSHITGICRKAHATIGFSEGIPSEGDSNKIFLGFNRKTDGTIIPLPDKKKDIGLEAYTLLCDGKNIYICGNSPKGTLNGVYGFLEDKLGIRWLNWKPDGTYIPEVKNFSLPVFCEQETPAVPYRDIYVCDMPVHPMSMQIAEQLWIVRNRLAPLWGTVVKFWFFNNRVKKDICPMGSMSIGHAFWKIYPRYKKILDSDPDNFSTVKGKSTIEKAKNGEKVYWQFSYSSPTVRDVCTDFVTKALDRQTESISISLSQNDGSVFSCERDRLKYSSDTDALIDFINDICRRTQGKLKDKKISFLVYLSTEAPPLKNIEIHQNALPVFCPLYNRLAHNRTINSDEETPSVFSWKNYLGKWLPLIKGYFAVHDYPALSEWDGETYIYVENARLWAKTKKLLGHSSEASKFLHGHFTDAQFATFWATAKVLWNPEQKTDDVLNDYLRHYFGPASQTVENILKKIDKAYREQPPVKASPCFRRKLYTDKLLDEIIAKISDMEKKGLKEPYRSRLLRFKYDFQARKIEQDIFDARKKYHINGTGRNFNSLIKLLENSKNFFDGLTESDYGNAEEKSEMVSELIKNYKNPKKLEAFSPGKFQFEDTPWPYGGMAKRDAINIKNLEPGRWGWDLPAGKSGFIEYEFKATPGHKFKEAQVCFFMYPGYKQQFADQGVKYELSEKEENSSCQFSISTDGGKTYKTLIENKAVTRSFPVSLSDDIKNCSSFRLKWSGKNAGSENLCFWGFFNIKGEVE